MKLLVVTSIYESTEDLREFSRLRGLHFTDWLTTKQNIVTANGMTGMMSQLLMRSLEDNFNASYQQS